MESTDQTFLHGCKRACASAGLKRQDCGVFSPSSSAQVCKHKLVRGSQQVNEMQQQDLKLQSTTNIHTHTHTLATQNRCTHRHTQNSPLSTLLDYYELSLARTITNRKFFTCTAVLFFFYRLVTIFNKVTKCFNICTTVKQFLQYIRRR